MSTAKNEKTESKNTEAETLHHYTSIEGFEGIINSQSLRMTESDLLNDPNDCKLFIKIVKEYLNDKIINQILSDTISEYQITDDNKNSIEFLLKNGCDFISYIEHIHNHIPLFVTSFTVNDNHDSTNMWSYYGKSGMELTFDKNKLFSLFKSTLSSETEYLIPQPVIYVSDDDISNIDKIPIPNFSTFILVGKDYDNIFEKHKKEITETNNGAFSYLYDTKELSQFIKTHLKSYMLTLNYLLQSKNTDEQITTNTHSDKIFNRVFTNVSKLYGNLQWKHDLSLFMLILSSLIKHTRYSHEKEYRIVYFNYDMDAINNRKQLQIKPLTYGEKIESYINLFDNSDTNSKNGFYESIKSITTSPSIDKVLKSTDEYIANLKSKLTETSETDIPIKVSQR